MNTTPPNAAAEQDVAPMPTPRQPWTPPRLRTLPLSRTERNVGNRIDGSTISGS